MVFPNEAPAVVGKSMPRGARDLIPDDHKRHIRQNLGDSYALHDRPKDEGKARITADPELAPRKVVTRPWWPIYVNSPSGERAKRFTAREYGRRAAREIAVDRARWKALGLKDDRKLPMDARESIARGEYFRADSRRTQREWPRIFNQGHLGVRRGLAWTDEMPADRAARKKREQAAYLERIAGERESARLEAENARRLSQERSAALIRAKGVRHARAAAIAGATAATVGIAGGATAGVIRARRSRRHANFVDYASRRGSNRRKSDEGFEKADSASGPSVIFRGSDGKMKRAVFADKQARNRWLLDQQRRSHPEAYARSMRAIRDSGRSRELLGKADRVEELPVPGWARASFAPGPVPVIDPLNVYAAGRLVAFGGKRARGEVTWPWMRGRMARGGLEQAQGLTMLYSPAGFGERTL